MGRDDLALVGQARAGDLKAFEALYRSSVGRVYGLCLRMLADPVAAEDVTQEVFVKAWQKLPGFEGRSAFSTWLHRLAVNAVLDRRRAEKRRGIPVDPAAAEATAAAGELTARSSSPDVTIDLERALAKLPEGARTAFVLHDVEGYRHREIAEMTGLAEGTWKAQLHRARKLLRRELQQ